MTEAVTFFREVLGAYIHYDIGPYQASDDWMTENLGVSADAVIPTITMIRVGNGPAFELFEY